MYVLTLVKKEKKILRTRTPTQSCRPPFHCTITQAQFLYGSASLHPGSFAMGCHPCCRHTVIVCQVCMFILSFIEKINVRVLKHEAVIRHPVLPPKPVPSSWIRIASKKILLHFWPPPSRPHRQRKLPKNRQRRIAMLLENEKRTSSANLASQFNNASFSMSANTDLRDGAETRGEREKRTGDYELREHADEMVGDTAFITAVLPWVCPPC